MTKQEFIAVLRSGTYKQTNGRLRTDDCFCVMGVACDLVDPNAWRNDHSWNGSYYSVPGKAWQGVGLTAWESSKIVGMNDAGVSFVKIADWLESQ